VSIARSSRWKPIACAAAAALIVAGLGGTATDIGPWYYGLHKPSFQPPDWAFAPAWTIIYALGAIAGVLGWRAARNRRDRARLLGAFALNALLNIMWSELFFHFQRPDWALYESVLLWLSVLVLILLLAPTTPTAAWVLTPYLAWVTFATVLNYAVLQLNAPFKGI
jgi:tryptophan-rich sensory protein